jgi:cytochrome c553
VIRQTMKNRSPVHTAAFLCASLAPLLIGYAANAQEVLRVPDGLPDWAFNIPDKVQPSAVKVEGIVKARGSKREYEATKIAGNATPPDWFPEEHPPAPKAVTGGEGIRFACGSCHLMSGQSHAEAADIAGMPAQYLMRQMQYYKDGSRLDDARMGPIAKTTSDENIREAAEYFSSLKPRPFVKVIETATPPKTFIATAGRHRQLHPDGGTEPIGERIIQIPEDPFGTEIRDPHAGYIAYVPPGSIAKGEALVKDGACATCHGEGLKGKGDVPRIAGLQPLQVTRQLFLIQHGSSGGKTIEPMKPVVAKLTPADIIAISAYAGSLPPS